MVDQNTFLETLNSVKEIISTSEKMLTEEEMLSYFADMELDGSQKAMVIDYLTNPENYKDKKEDAQSVDSETEEKQSKQPEEDTVNVYQMYLDELDALQAYSDDEMDGFYKLLLQGDESVIEKISHAWLSPITKVAEKYLEERLLLEDLVQEGNMALFMELSRLCGTMEKVDVAEVLADAIESGIMAYAGQIRDAKELEESMVGKINLVNAARTILAEENGQVPTVKELAEYTKIAEWELESIQDIMKEAENKK